MHRVLIIGIDGGTWSVLDPLIDLGVMPFLCSVRRAGTSGVLESVKPPITAAAWASFQTGTFPGQHGVCGFYSFDRDRGQVYPVTSSALGKTLWECAGEEGRRVGAVNVPMTYPPRSINGHIVAGLLTPSLKSSFTFPLSLRDELLRHVPKYRILPTGASSFYRPYEDAEGFLQQMTDLISVRTTAAKYLLSQHEYDLFMVHFQAVDLVQHALWKYVSRVSTLGGSDVEKALCGFYRTLDNSMEAVCETFLQAVGKGDSLLLIMSDHGFQRHLKRVNLGNWLASEGYTHILPSARSASLWNGSRVARLAGSGFHKMLRKVLKRPLPSVMPQLAGTNVRVDLRRSLYYPLGGSHWGLLYSLEKNGTQKDSEQRLSEQILRTIDERAGQNTIRGVWRADKLYPNSQPLSATLPDLWVEPQDGYSVSSRWTPDARIVEPIDETVFHQGIHHLDGIIASFGTGVLSGALDSSPCIVDVAPTILAAMGVPIPGQMEGYVVKALCPDACNIQQKTHESDEPPRQPWGDYTRNEERAIEDRLRDLGYV